MHVTIDAEGEAEPNSPIRVFESAAGTIFSRELHFGI